MALITCPDCGQQISEHSDHCIHCGCKITVCHTCGKVYAGSGECPVCHAVPAETQKISQQNNRKNTMDLFDDWEHSLPPYDLKKQWQSYFRSKNQKMRIANIVFGCIAGMGLVFLIYALYILHIWEPDSLEELLDIDAQALSGKVFVWMALICILLGFIGSNLINSWELWKYYEWLNAGQGAEARVKAMLSMAATKADINSYSLLIRDLYRAKKKKYVHVAGILMACILIPVVLLLFDVMYSLEMNFSLLFDDFTGVLGILVAARMFQSEEPVGPAIKEAITSFWEDNFSTLLIVAVIILAITLVLLCSLRGKKEWLRRIAPDDCKRLRI